MASSFNPRHRMVFAKRSDDPDGRGNPEGDWIDQFTCDAEVIPLLRGGEEVIASRLAGVQPVILRIRSCIAARLIETHWKATDERRPTVVYNIKSIANLDQRDQFLDVLASSGEPV